MSSFHPTPSGKTGYVAGCKCEPCKEAKRRYEREAHRRKVESGAAGHGAAMYRAGCRCERCCYLFGCAEGVRASAERKRSDPAWRERKRKIGRESASRRRADPKTRARLWAKARDAAKARRDMIQRIKVERGCADCGWNQYAEALDFDHVDPKQKKAAVSRIKTLSLEAILAEIAKCEVVCANCHRIRTAKRREAITD